MRKGETSPLRHSAVYRSEPLENGDVAITKIARTGDPAPDGNGIFPYADNCELALNNAGQMAFMNEITDTEGDHFVDEAIFFFDDARGLQIVARTEMPLLGSTVTDLAIRSGTGDDHGCLNEEGCVAFRFCLADGREGIAVWRMPPQ